MDTSFTNLDLSESINIKIGTDSENSSDKSDPIEIIGYADVDPNSSSKSDDFDNNLPETVTLLTHEETGAKVYLIGTAHFSKESQDDVQLVIRKIQPHVVVVELCRSRTSILDLDESTILEEARKIDMAKVVATMKTNGVINGLMYILMLNMSAHITKEIGMAPGGEFRVAYREAEKIRNCSVYLGDRPIDITLRRAISGLSWFQTIKLAWHLLTSKDGISVEEIEKCKNRDMLEQLLAEMAGEYPALRKVFLDERDIYLTNSIQQAAKRTDAKPNDEEPLRVVAVVGIGHAPGIIRLWPENQRHLIPDILVIPPPSLTSKIFKFSIKLSILGFGGYLVYKYVPIPRSVGEKTQSFIQNILSNIKTNPGLKYLN